LGSYPKRKKSVDPTINFIQLKIEIDIKMSNVTSKYVRNSLTEYQKQEIIDMWIKANAFDNITMANQRLEEVFAIALDETGKIVAVSTCYKDIDPILKFKLHFIRAFVAESSREFKVGTEFIVFIMNTLEKEYDPNNKDLPIGAAWVLENELVKNNYKLAVSRQTKSTFYGYHNGANPARVRFFSNAKLPSQPLDDFSYSF